MIIIYNFQVLWKDQWHLKYIKQFMCLKTKIFNQLLKLFIQKIMKDLIKMKKIKTFFMEILLD